MKIKPAKTKQTTPPSPHRRSKPKRLGQWLWLVLGGLSMLFGVGLILFVVSQPFREKVDELYYTLYAAVHTDPTLNDYAVKHANIAYCGTNSRFQKLDIYVPRWARVTGQLPPAAIYVHGGGWAVGDKTSTHLTKYGPAILSRNIALVSVNYRLAPQVHYPVQNSDLACAILFLRDHGRDYGIDGNRLGLWGDSAGGQLSAIAAFDPNTRPAIRAVAELYGTADVWGQISRKPRDSRAVAYIGNANNPARQKSLAMQASPVNANVTGAPPFLLFHGRNDRTVPFSQSVALQKKLQAAGVPVTLRAVDNADHNFTEKSRPSVNDIKHELAGFFDQQLKR